MTVVRVRQLFRRPIRPLAALVTVNLLLAGAAWFFVSLDHGLDHLFELPSESGAVPRPWTGARYLDDERVQVRVHLDRCEKQKGYLGDARGTHAVVTVWVKPHHGRCWFGRSHDERITLDFSPLVTTVADGACTPTLTDDCIRLRRS